ncbi:MAG: hypothetical protein JNL70_03850 [Saprospiraceae bacterium]|nr:hypothetical protein [Saprospiraceae bacterium]
MTSKKLLLELVWWVLTAVVVGVVMYPIWTKFPDYSFNWVNIITIAAFITFARYTFFLEYTFLAKLEKTKIAFVLVTFALVATLLREMQNFNVWIDGGDPDILLGSVIKPGQRESLLGYIKSEFLFFIVGSIVSALFLAGRLLVSVWRLRNRGKV